jgi:hypothetical protein
VKRLDDEVREALREAFKRPVRNGDLRRLGLGDHDVQRLIRNNSLQRHHAWFIDGKLDAQFAAIQCAQAAHPGSVVSHFTSATLSGLRVWTDDADRTEAVWLTCPPGKQRRNLSRADLVLRRAGLEAADLQRVRGLLATSVARTVVDLARELPLREAVVTIDHALAVSVRREDLELTLQRQRHWSGVQQARAAVAFADPRSESALESIARVLFAAAGLPPPVLQAQFWDGRRWMSERVDFWWPEFRTVVEADGLAKFEAPTAAKRRRLLRRSFERDQRLADRDLELVHFGWEDAVLKPDELAARMRAAFTRAQRRTTDHPTWRTTDPTDPAVWPRPLDPEGDFWA